MIKELKTLSNVKYKLSKVDCDLLRSSKMKIHIKRFYKLNNLPITQLQSEKIKDFPIRGRFRKTPKNSLSNMSTKTNMPTFSYENVINHYLAEGPIPADKWDQPDRNATKTETSETNTIIDANDHQVNDPK